MIIYNTTNIPSINYSKLSKNNSSCNFYGYSGKAESNIIKFLDSKPKKTKEWMNFVKTLSDAIQNCIIPTVEKHKNDGLTIENYLPMAVKGKLLYIKSETIDDRIAKFTDKFKNEQLKKEDYMQACFKFPQLLTQTPDTLEKNVRNLVELFKDEELLTKEYLQACLKQPTLFYQAPKTIEQNIRGVVTIFEKEGLSLKKYLKACVQYPCLFCRKPNAIEKNIRNVVKLFEKEGLTTEGYISACIKQPPLFYISPNKIEQNINNLVAEFQDKGLKTSDYINVCLKMPAYFYRNPETMSKSIKALEFAYKNENRELNDKEIMQKILQSPILMSYSPKLIYLSKIVIPQMKKQDKDMAGIWGNKIKQKVIEYLKDDSNKKKNYTINVISSDVTEDFVKTTTAFFEKQFGPNNPIKFKIDKNNNL